MGSAKPMPAPLASDSPPAPRTISAIARQSAEPRSAVRRREVGVFGAGLAVRAERAEVGVAEPSVEVTERRRAHRGVATGAPGVRRRRPTRPGSPT